MNVQITLKKGSNTKFYYVYGPPSQIESFLLKLALTVCVYFVLRITNLGYIGVFFILVSMVFSIFVIVYLIVDVSGFYQKTR